MPGASAPFVDGWKFFVSRSSCSACLVWKRSTISITLRRLIRLAMAAPIPFDSPGTTASFSTRFSVFIVIPFIVGFFETVYTRSCADLTIHISESRLIIFDLAETMPRQHVVVSHVGRLQTETLHVGFHQIGQQQVRERRQVPRPFLFFVENDSYDIPQAGVSLLVISLQAVFQSRNRAGC